MVFLIREHVVLSKTVSLKAYGLNSVSTANHHKRRHMVIALVIFLIIFNVGFPLLEYSLLLNLDSERDCFR